MSDSEDHVDPVDDAGDDDLFGDDDEVNDAVSEAENALSDRELASDGDEDEGAARAARDASQDEAEFREKTVSGVPLYRHRIPKSADGSLYSLRVPEFLKLNPVEYKPNTWEPSRWDVENANAETPIPVVLSRRNPKTEEMQSNTNIYRWSDGSVTIAIGDEHYEIQSKRLAPPPNKEYQEVQDAHYYAAAAHLTTNSLLIIGHFTEQYTVRPNKEVQDHALERLKANLAETKRDKTEIIAVAAEDPELQKKQAELAEKERLKLQRRREAAAARAADGAGSRYKGGALSIGDLEGGRRGAGSGRKRGPPGGAKKKHRRPEYDSDDDLPRGARREDNYDMEDGFLVDSEEESEEAADDDEEEELLDDDDDDEEAPRKRRKTAEVDEDADGDDDADTPAHAAESSSRRRRRVIDDDEE